MKGLFWKIAGLSFILSGSRAARNYADYDHDYTDASNQDNYGLLAPWVVGIIVSICLIAVVVVILLVVCCLCCSTRQTSPEVIAHATGNRTIFLTAVTSHQTVPSKSTDLTGCTNAAFAPTQEPNVETQRVPQIIAPPPPYSERHDNQNRTEQIAI